jgi:hypothetical protein
VKLEVSGWDVFIKAEWNTPLITLSERKRAYFIEIKTSLGDDYPAVPRQMKSVRPRGECMLLVGQYSGQGASLDQVRRIFQASTSARYCAAK